MITVLTILAGILVVVVITAFTGYFVAQEFAYMAVDRSRLSARAAAGDEASARALQVTRRTSFMLSGAQLGITVTGLLVGYVAEPMIGQSLGSLLGGVGVPTAVGVGIGAFVAVGLSTVVQMVFGELFPKNLAIARPEPVARRLAFSTTLYLRVFGWLIRFFDQASNMLLRAVRIEPVHDVEHSATPRDLEHIVAASRDAGELPRELSTLLDRILDFPDHTAEHAMIPRARVDVVRADEPAAAVLDRMADGHTRYPVIGETADDLIGVITMHDLLGDASGDARSRCRPAVIVPGSMPLPTVVAQLAEAGREMALVIDEYGGFDGVVTVEDIAEELVGEIDDEHDGSDPEPAVRDDSGWLLRGDVHLDEVERLLDVDLEPGDAETLGGAVTARLGALPRPGDIAELPLMADPAALPGAAPDVLRAEVRTVERRVPSSVHLSRRAGAEKEADDE
ncbi:HlyC/CorC family transporter [Tsukamurella asaccharolytica]|uniref:HlyC/CorC family transporter n=1 Tax=Tsukamurella asaccharolytica TaxID=2592067 RepID=A0A5C5R4Q9_9ACTN|nr:hemolysin family protein [Tsukamurella asaccharolytica]TWS17656.1 HlyC/CorC family transporter [Tsukamurella asaccharolytica]